MPADNFHRSITSILILFYFPFQRGAAQHRVTMFGLVRAPVSSKFDGDKKWGVGWSRKAEVKSA